MKIAIGSDHGGFKYKKIIIKHLKDIGHTVLDVGPLSEERSNYPTFGIAVGEAVQGKRADFGIVICTTGEGIAIAANKVKGIRAGIGYNDEVARLMRLHNDANVISFGQAHMDIHDVLRRIDIFLTTPFEGGRHATRVDIIKDYEK
ncbi:MAG: ribose 5-phosphate isomerase B [Erysipelotrichaceae bacterium]|jgi:ribose 5-phosphate isomerase B|nr:ribose 5-phosphate isomerase B [Bacilli bacterium]NLJ32481.1 ribose 5-phosphate isomerase B [Erysipelotrichaceae bacterium]